MNTENTEDYLKFLQLREQARIYKENGQKYDLDPIIAKTRFTNVNKWDDKTSKLFLERAKKSSMPRAEALLAIYFRYDIYRDMPIEIEEILDFLKAGKGRRTPAYMVSPILFKETMNTLADIIENGDMSIDYIKNIKGIGDFILNQYVSNVRKLEGLYKDFFIAGKGTKKGFELIMGRKYKSYDDILLVKSILIKNLPKEMTDYFDDINNVGNTLCEYSKYNRLTKNPNSTKRNYEPR